MNKINRITDREKRIIQMRLEGKTYQEIADETSNVIWKDKTVTASRIRFLFEQGIKKMLPIKQEKDSKQEAHSSSCRFIWDINDFFKEYEKEKIPMETRICIDHFRRTFNIY